MPKKPDTLLGTVSIIVSILVGITVMSESACDRWLPAALAREKFADLDSYHKINDDNIRRLADIVARIDERTRTCE